MKLFCILLAVIFAYALPIAATVIWCRKTKASIVPVLIGAVTFFVFANVLEQLLHIVCLLNDNAVSRFLNGNVWAYGLYGAFAAGIFEETGRFVAFKTVLRRYTPKQNAIAYGIGHGGIEVILILGMNYLLLAIAALTGFSAGLESLQPSFEAITSGIVATAALERIFAFTVHIALSVFVFTAVHRQEKGWMFPLAILLHALLDFPAVFCQQGLLSVAALECYVGVFAILLSIAAFMIYRRFPSQSNPDVISEQSED